MGRYECTEFIDAFVIPFSEGCTFTVISDECECTSRLHETTQLRWQDNLCRGRGKWELEFGFTVFKKNQPFGCCCSIVLFLWYYWMMNHPGCSLSHCCQRSSDDCHVTITYFYALLLRSYSCWMSLSKVTFQPYGAPAFQTFATLRICAPILSNAASAHKHHFRTLYKQLTSMLAYYPADEC